MRPPRPASFRSPTGFVALLALAFTPALPAAARQPAALKAVELYAQAGRTADLARHRAPFVNAGGALAQTVALAEFRGQMNSIEVPLTVHPTTFSDLPITDTSEMNDMKRLRCRARV